MADRKAGRGGLHSPKINEGLREFPFGYLWSSQMRFRCSLALGHFPLGWCRQEDLPVPPGVKGK